MADSLVLARNIELMGGGQPSTLPQCLGAIFRLGKGYDLGNPQYVVDLMTTLMGDGSAPIGWRADNRTVILPVVIAVPVTSSLANDRLMLSGARELLLEAITADEFTLLWSPDGQAGALNLIWECFRAKASTVTHDVVLNRQRISELVITFEALPYGRSDTQQQIAFAAPIPQTPPPPPAPVVIDTFSTISSTQHFQSDRCIVGPRSCGWDPDDARVGDPGGQANRFLYTNASLATTLNLTGMTSIAMWLGFGSRYYTYLEYHGKIHGVSLYVTLTDTSGNTLGMSRTGLRLPVSPDAQQPVFSRVSMPIPASTTFNYSSVGGYTIEILNRHDRIRRLSWVTAFVDALTAYPPSQTANPVTRGALYTLYGLQGTARSAMTLAFQQPPTAGTVVPVT